MKINFTDKPPNPPEESFVGNVYRCKGGNKSKYWVIVAVRHSTAICLGLDDDGNITSSMNCGIHVFDGWPFSRHPLGRVVEMPDLVFPVEWF